MSARRRRAPGRTGGGTNLNERERERQLVAFYTQHDKIKACNAGKLLEEYTEADIAASLFAKYGAVPDGWTVPSAGLPRKPLLLAIAFIATACACVYVGRGGVGVSRASAQGAVHKSVPADQPPPTHLPSPPTLPGTEARAAFTLKRVEIVKQNKAINIAQTLLNSMGAAALSRRGSLENAEKQLNGVFSNYTYTEDRQQYLAHCEETLHHYSKAIALDSTPSSTHFNYGNLLYKAKRVDEAVVMYRTALKQGDDSYQAAKVHSNLAVAYNAQGKYEDAHATFAIAQRIDDKLSDTPLPADITDPFAN